ncbi:alpha/beta fold hydrolase [Rhizorhabdus dicambivorans]|uniref:Alpha/beta hydrolase n=1 Tax=Rhizorhabdus dicambivorans TaxID=1850238 RepID=A0A2A4FUV2_9SPHN|nr:alpha/beta hydrolase [Rhizorhabdus dicambivorans]ATE65746.1 alpha/beta hydrolase [Rhizorhabdus dicambivorans]PCE41171.1 alpha/beta hydrolase [Rhizorhabdus dicambivorans]
MTDLTLRNGTQKLAVSLFGNPDGPPVVFLHGVSLSRDTWAEVANGLAQDYQIWTLDFRGHGHSDHADGYSLDDYVSDARTLLKMIDRPATLVGHSLGGCVAGVLAQSAVTNISGVFLEDPPWYLGEPGEWARSVYPRLFTMVRAQQADWQEKGEPLQTYYDFFANAPSPAGGRASDHISHRHLLSHASSLQRQDNRCWGDDGSVVQGSVLAEIDTTAKILCPVTLLQGDPAYGAAFLDGHENRFKQANPDARVVGFPGIGHNIHRTVASAPLFLAELRALLSKVAR